MAESTHLSRETARSISRSNGTDRICDCRCHGSRFDEIGAVLVGPATEPLEPLVFGEIAKAER